MKFKSNNDFRVLLVYPNIQMSALMPLSMGVFTALLREKGFKIKAVFIDYDAVSVDDQETLLYVRDKMKFDSIFKTYSQLVRHN